MNAIQCTLCGGTECEELASRIRNDTDNDYTMYRCKNCETHFMFPVPSKNQLENYYDGKFREEVHTDSYYSEERLTTAFNSFTSEAKVRVSRIERELHNTDSILEIGCSVGYFLAAIADKVEKVYGTEWDSNAREYIANVICHPKIQVAKNPEDFQTKFDKIFMFHVLEHIEDPIAYLQSLKTLLKDRGTIYIEVPNVDDILVKTFQCTEFKDFYYKKAHLYNFNEKSLSYVFEEAGYDYQIDFIQRYDISNHFFWLVNKKPGGKGAYKDIFSDSLNEMYTKDLVKAKQTDTLLARIRILK